MTNERQHAEYVAVLEGLLMEARECEGLQNWDEDLCLRIDQALRKPCAFCVAGTCEVHTDGGDR